MLLKQLKLGKKKGDWYKYLCNSLGKTFEFPLEEADRIKLSENLEFCGLDVKSNYVYPTSIIVLIAGVAFSLIFFFLSQYLLGLLIAVGALGFSYYITIYPAHLTRYYRIKATSDLVQTIFYLVISLRLVPNLETALMFASKNVKGIVGRDLKKLAWGMSTGKYRNADEVLDRFARKWKKENLEFYEAVNLIRISILQRKERRESLLDESISVMLKGNMERMKHYSTELRNPLLVLTTLGITLPVLTIILFPIMTIFLTNTINPVYLFIFYDFLLPIVVYYLMNETLRSRPLSLGTVDISLHPKAKSMRRIDVSLFNKKFSIPIILIAILIGLIVSLIGYNIALTSDEPVSLAKIVGGLIILGGICISVVIYSYLQYKDNIDVRDEIKEMERGFDEVLFQLGYTLSTGVPLETALEQTVKKTGNLKISKLFRDILTTIRKFGFTFKRTLFDKKYGILKYYPSRIIRSTITIISDSIDRGVAGMSKTVLSVSEYLKSMHLVEEHMKEILEETTSSMKMMMTLLVPIASGAVVGMATIMTMVLFQIDKMLADVTGLSTAYPENFSESVLGTMVDIKSVMPAEVFLVVVGVYMLEIVLMLAVFIGALEHGDDPLDKHQLIAKNVIFSYCLFSVCLLFIYFIFRNLIMIWGP